MSFNISYILQIKDKFTPQLRRVNQSLRTFRNNIKKLSKDTAKLKKIQGNLNKGGRAFRKATIGIGVGLGFALRTASKFEAKMINVHSVSQATGDEMHRLISGARDIAVKSVFTPEQVAEGMLTLAKSGLKANQVMQATAPILNLATAGMADMKTATELTTSIMKSFQLDFSKTTEVTDILAQAFTKSNTDIFRLSEGFKMLGATASSLGLSVKDATTGLMVMSEAGVHGGMAGRQLARLLVQLNVKAKPLQKAFTMMGIKAFDANGHIIDFSATIEGLIKLQKVAAKRGKETEFIKAVTGGQIAGKAFRTFLLAGEKKLRSFGKALDEAGGRAKVMAEQHMEGVIGATKKLNSAFQDLSLSIFDKKVMNDIANAVGRVAAAIRDISKNHPMLRKIGTVFLVILGLIAPILFGLAKMVFIMRVLGIASSISLGGMVAGLGRVTAALWAAKGAMGFLAVAGTAIGMGFSKWDEYALTLEKIQDALKGIVYLFKSLKDHAGLVGQVFGQKMKELGQNIKHNVMHPLQAINSEFFGGGGGAGGNAPAMKPQNVQGLTGKNGALNINLNDPSGAVKSTTLSNPTGQPMNLGTMGSGALPGF